MLGHGIRAIREHLTSLPNMRGASVETLRDNYDKAEYVFECPADIEVDSVMLRSVPSEVLTPANAVPGRTVLYLHGGGYALGSPRSHRHLAAAIANRAGVRGIDLRTRDLTHVDVALVGGAGTVDAAHGSPRAAS